MRGARLENLAAGVDMLPTDAWLVVMRAWARRRSLLLVARCQARVRGRRARRATAFIRAHHRLMTDLVGVSGFRTLQNNAQVQREWSHEPGSWLALFQDRPADVAVIVEECRRGLWQDNCFN